MQQLCNTATHRLGRLPVLLQITTRIFILTNPDKWPFHWRLHDNSSKTQREVYLCKNLRNSCLAIPSSSHACANFTLSCSALHLISCPFSPRQRSITCRISIPTASRVPSGATPFLARGLRMCPVLTWKNSKATLRLSERYAAFKGWSAATGQQILRKR